MYTGGRGAGMWTHPLAEQIISEPCSFFIRNWVYTAKFGLKIRIFLCKIPTVHTFVFKSLHTGQRLKSSCMSSIYLRNGCSICHILFLSHALVPDSQLQCNWLLIIYLVLIRLKVAYRSSANGSKLEIVFSHVLQTFMNIYGQCILYVTEYTRRIYGNDFVYTWRGVHLLFIGPCMRSHTTYSITDNRVQNHIVVLIFINSEQCLRRPFWVSMVLTLKHWRGSVI